jgi:putative ABC transport system ATP-binding protein
MMSNSYLHLSGVSKSYPDPESGVPKMVLDIAEFKIEPGTQVAIAGSSGGGKTTLLHCIAGIVTPDTGSITVSGTDISKLRERKRDRFRANHIGYVYQTFNLIQGFTALENVMLGMLFSGKGVDKDKAESLLVQMGLKDRLNYKPSQLSVGQQQRVSIARAVVNDPDLVLADEPTGNLDPASSEEALTLLKEVSKGKMLLLVSHEQDVLDRFDRVIALQDINRARMS